MIGEWNDTVINSGRINGNVDLGGGNDAFDASAAKAAVGGTVTGGEGVDTLTGSKFADMFDGGDGNDTLTGNVGNDLLGGGGDNDTIGGGKGNDQIDGGTGDDGLSGDEGLDELVGGDGNDTLNGGNGNDTLAGGEGDDTLDGGQGMDTITGGIGRDVATGGAGADHFVFGEGDFAAGPLFDEITDFKHSQKDKIDLSSIDAVAGGLDDAFSFIGAVGFGGVAGELHYVAGVGQVTVEGDTNGDAIADFSITVLGVASLVAGDFIA